jgi:Tfp pilus assembly ATPase PilU
VTVQAESSAQARRTVMEMFPGGRKRHLLVDTLGLILVAVVHSAAIQDRDGAKLVIQKARWFGWLRVIFADAAL